MELKANELKVGNLYIDVCGKVSMWRESSFNHYKCAKVPLTELKPITLTEEWLIKFGFEKVIDCDNHYQFKDNFEYSIIIQNNKHYLAIEKYNGECLDVEAEYLHQLQNLYFALTQTELTIK